MSRLKQYLRNLFSPSNPPETPAAKPAEPERPNTRAMQAALAELSNRNDAARSRYYEMVGELIEARQMAGAGPWIVGPAAREQTDKIIAESARVFRESSNSITAQGVYGDIELALQNVEWRREVNMSWMEFSRWGIQQIILICRLHYIKNPIIRRLIDVCAAYVFARGMEVSSNDPDANEVLEDFFERNQCTLGHTALVDLERRKDYDGNLFFTLFADTQDKGVVSCRTIDATEIQDIYLNPDDSDDPWFYKRVSSAAERDPTTGQLRNGGHTVEKWYPALRFEPSEKSPQANQPDIGGVVIDWNVRVLHRKAGAIAKWMYGCPRIYPANAWAKEAKTYLESCASVAAALAQVAATIKTKGGQQAIEGMKQQIGASVGPTSALWDQNPPAVAGATFVSGPGTTLEAFKTQGAGLDPAKVSWYIRMACMSAGVPPHFLGDVEDTNRATATSLDRPTETMILEKQEAWREDIITLSKYVLSVSRSAPSGRLKESVSIREASGHYTALGRWVYEAKAARGDGDPIEVRADFPAIREGDIPQLVEATVKAMTLDNKAGQVIGIDERAGVEKLYDLIGIEGGDELSEKQYPEGEYDPDRTKQIIPPPIERPQAFPGGKQPTPAQAPDQRLEPTPGTNPNPREADATEWTRRVGITLNRIQEALKWR